MSVIECANTHFNTDISEYIWIIEDFPLLRALAVQRALPNYDRIMSPKFGDQYNGTWFLALFPAGVNCDGNLLSIYLFTSSEQIKIALFEISILDEEFNVIEGSTASLSHPRVFSTADPSWGWEDYMQIRYIEENESDTLENLSMSTTQIIPFPLENNTTDGIRSSQELIYVTEEDSGISDSHYSISSREYEDNITDTDTYTNWRKTILKYFVFDDKIRIKLVIKSYNDLTHTSGSVVAPSLIKERNVAQDYLWLAKDFSNFSLECPVISSEMVTINCNEEYFQVPKFTLAARSTYFRKMFISGFSDSKTLRISIPVDEAKPFVVRNALDYISTGDCELLNHGSIEKLSEIIELFRFSDKYGIYSLYNACIPIIIANISVKSIWAIMVVAQQCNSKVILNATNDFLKNNNDISSLATTLISHLTGREKTCNLPTVDVLNTLTEHGKSNLVLNSDIQKESCPKEIKNNSDNFCSNNINGIRNNFIIENLGVKDQKIDFKYNSKEKISLYTQRENFTNENEGNQIGPTAQSS